MKKTQQILASIIILIIFLSVFPFTLQAQADTLDIERILLSTPTGQTTSFGWAVTSGDFDGNGFQDVVVSDESFSTIYIYYGALDFSSTSSDQSISRTADIGFGFYLASAGDTNGDGYDELLVSKGWGYNNVYLYRGSASGLDEAPFILASPEGYNSYGFGHSLAGAGDINGDGFSDFMISSGGRKYVCLYYGASTGIPTSHGQILEHTGPGGQSTNVTGIGDINGDGFDDVAVNPENGDIYVFFGSATGVGTTPQILTVPDSASSVKLASAGDVNSDGYADLLVGNQWVDGTEINLGRAYVYYGSNGGLSTSPDTVIDNPLPSYNPRFGSAVAGIGDYNHDCVDDIIVGAPYNGFAAVYYGSASGVATAPSHIFTEPGWFGWAVSPVGDIKGNGQNFVVVGTEFHSANAYLYSLEAPSNPCFCDNDIDNDSVYCEIDNCPYFSNPLQEDIDNDGVGDVCDNCPYDEFNDIDNDGVCTAVDNCPYVSNSEQEDTDSDGEGDACDLDFDEDSDGIISLEDNCPTIVNSGQEDVDNDGVGNVCDDDTLVGTIIYEFGEPVVNLGVNIGKWNQTSGKYEAYEYLRTDKTGNYVVSLPVGYYALIPYMPNDCTTEPQLYLKTKIPVPELGTYDFVLTCPENDIDGDGILNDDDNCPNNFNSQQFDADNDSIGDVCDPNPGCGGCGEDPCEVEC